MALMAFSVDTPPTDSARRAPARRGLRRRAHRRPVARRPSSGVGLRWRSCRRHPARARRARLRLPRRGRGRGAHRAAAATCAQRRRTPPTRSAARSGRSSKSIALVCDRSSVVALLPGDRRVDLDRVARLVGASAGRLATAEEVERHHRLRPRHRWRRSRSPPSTTSSSSGVSSQHRVVWAGAGSDRHLVSLAPRELAAALAGAARADRPIARHAVRTS